MSSPPTYIQYILMSMRGLHGVPLGVDDMHAMHVGYVQYILMSMRGLHGAYGGLMICMPCMWGQKQCMSMYN